jgi:hypothetical protein
MTKEQRKNHITLPEQYTVPKPYSINDFKNIVPVPSTDIILLVTDHVFGGDYILVIKPDGFNGIYPSVALNKTMYCHDPLSSNEQAEIEKTVNNL